MEVTIGLPPSKDYSGQFIGIDTEFYNMRDGKLHRPHGDFAMLTISVDDKNTYAILDEKDIPKALKIIDKGVHVYQNAAFDVPQLRRFAEIKQRYIHDCLLIERILYGGYYSQFALDDLSRRYLGRFMSKEERYTFSEGRTTPTKAQINYGAKDAHVTRLVAVKQAEAMDSEDRWVYENIDLPNLWASWDMQGVKVNVSAWELMVDDFERRANELQDELGFNVKSPQQTKKAVEMITGIRLPDTQEATFNEYKDEHEIFNDIIAARRYRHAVSSFGWHPSKPSY